MSKHIDRKEMAVIVILIIFVILAAALYWLGSCGSWSGTDYSMIQALFSSAALIYFVMDLLGPSSWIWKVIDVLIIILIIWMYWQVSKTCRLFNRM